MITRSPRPFNVTIVGVLLIVGAVLGIITSAITLLGLAGGQTLTVEGQALHGTELVVFSVIALVVGVSSLVLAIGIFRGNRVVRVLVTIVMILSIGSSLYSLIIGGGPDFSLSWEIVIPLIIVVALWTREDTKQFFAKS